jgi:hypothetical protein
MIPQAHEKTARTLQEGSGDQVEKVVNLLNVVGQPRFHRSHNAWRFKALTFGLWSSNAELKSSLEQPDFVSGRRSKIIDAHNALATAEYLQVPVVRASCVALGGAVFIPSDPNPELQCFESWLC